MTDLSERPTEPTLRQVAQNIVEELPALKQFLKDELGLIGWEYQVGVWEERLRIALAREPEPLGEPSPAAIEAARRMAQIVGVWTFLRSCWDEDKAQATSFKGITKDDYARDQLCRILNAGAGVPPQEKP